MERKLKIASEDEHLVMGEVYAPGIPDSDGEFMDAEGVKEMAYKFMKNLRLKAIDTAHNNKTVDGACVVESFIARKGDPDFIEGAWVVCSHIDDPETWAKIKKGEINSYSLEAFVTREPMQLDIEVPPVISGKTQKSGYASHEHEFYVSYAPTGEFLGGRTDMVDGHMHTIKRGTVTEDSNGHRHRFAHIDVMSANNRVEKTDISNSDLSTAGKKNPEQGKRFKKKRQGLSRYVR